MGGARENVSSASRCWNHGSKIPKSKATEANDGGKAVRTRITHPNPDRF
jgi:hypothetical protein